LDLTYQRKSSRMLIMLRALLWKWVGKRSNREVLVLRSKIGETAA
jgi:hypothetical protein